VELLDVEEILITELVEQLEVGLIPASRCR